MKIIVLGDQKIFSKSITLLKAANYDTPNLESNQTDLMDHSVTPGVVEHKVAAF